MKQKKKLTGADLILAERSSQIKKHKFDVKHGQIEQAVGKLIGERTLGRTSPPYMWSKEGWVKLLKKPLKAKLIICGALIAARIDMIIAEEEE
jgi:hypothetical protein